MAAFQATLKTTKVRIPVFFGTGLDDLSSGGVYTGTVDSIFTIIIDSTGTPDTFRFQKDNGTFTTGVSITGSGQTLSDGVEITFAATTGHTLNEKWEIEAVSGRIDATLSTNGKILSIKDHSNYITNTDAGHAESDFKDFRRFFITQLGGSKISLNDLTAINPHFDSANNKAFSDVVTFNQIAKDDIYDLELITVPTWNPLVSYSADKSVFLSPKLYTSNKTTTIGESPDGAGAADWDVTNEAGLSSIYRSINNQIATTFNLRTCRDKEVFNFHCNFKALCADEFCRDENSIKLFKIFLALEGVDISVELGEFVKAQDLLNEGNQLCK